MSLKAFHLIFITASSALAFGFGVWLFRSYLAEGQTLHLLASLGSFAVGIALLAYERYFLRKTKHVGYL